jgi:hypothetical protein
MHLLICLNVSVLHELVATGMRPVHPPTNIPPHCPQTNTLIRIGYVSNFFPSQRVLLIVLLQDPRVWRTLPFMTHNPPVAATSPPIRSDSLQLPRRAFSFFFFFFFLIYPCRLSAMTRPCSGHLHKDARYCNCSFKCILCGKAGHHARSQSCPKQGCFHIDPVEMTGEAVCPLIYRSHWSKQSLSLPSSLPTFQSSTSLSRISSNSPKDRRRDNAQLQ